MVIKGYQLTTLQVEHKVRVLFNEYDYPTKMVWTPSSSSRTSKYQLIADLSKMLGTVKYIRTQAGRPYRCDFGDLHVSSSTSGAVVITTKGFCKRVAESQVPIRSRSSKAKGKAKR